MKVPHISILSVMAVAAVAALDCFVFRSIAARPEFVAHEVWWTAVATLPMANFLAVAAALLARRRGAGRPDFLFGFQAAGWTVLLASIAWLNPILRLIETCLTSLGAVEWCAGSPIREAILIYAVAPTVCFVPQALVAAVGGWIARHFGRSRAKTTITDLTPRASRLARVVWLLMLVGIPAFSFETYLRLRVDPALRRLPQGSVAVVDFHTFPEFPVFPTKGSPLAKLAGTRIRVDSDADAWMPEFCVASNGDRLQRDHRVIQVTLLDGERSGESARLPHCMLRPTR
jgi:hypothetical protein